MAVTLYRGPETLSLRIRPQSDQLIVRFMSNCLTQFRIKNPTFWGQKHEVLTTVDMWGYKGRYIFFMQLFIFLLN